MQATDVLARREVPLTEGSVGWRASRATAMLVPSRTEGLDVQLWDGPEPLWRLPAHEAASPGWVACPASLEVGSHRGSWVTLSQADRRAVCAWVRGELGAMGAWPGTWPCEPPGRALMPACARVATGALPPIPAPGRDLGKSVRNCR